MPGDKFSRIKFSLWLFQSQNPWKLHAVNISRYTVPSCIHMLDVVVGSYILYYTTSQYIIYCGGEPEHHIRNVTSRSYILIAHKHNSCMCHESNVQLACLRITVARYYKFHAMLTG